MEGDSFERYVAQALEDVPKQLLERLENLEIVIEDWPDAETLRMARISSRYGLLGFYHGVPLTHRTTSYMLVAPDKISIYRRPIEAICSTEDELREMVGRVVRHEIAHYFGIDDDRLHELGAY
jgi:predicted Zn-dependent protease with MMP-like domain